MKILLAIDDSSCSQAATKSLLTQFRTQGAEVRVLSVVEPISVYARRTHSPTSLRRWRRLKRTARSRQPIW